MQFIDVNQSMGMLLDELKYLLVIKMS
jgi:hypothetical protein